LAKVTGSAKKAFLNTRNIATDEEITFVDSHFVQTGGWYFFYIFSLGQPYSFTKKVNDVTEP
jgi:hypothetical protein